ncbi:MAG TPA: aminoglycoside 6'-N-acetyltransferase [Burkholderiales bacterium]|nr:aminoglycoside 6'-N-acetyltransferase [Burkholderiales bacterium]
MNIAIDRCESLEHEGWLALRRALWPQASREEHLAWMAKQLARSGRYVQFVASSGPGRPVGFAEAAIRTDYVNGTDTFPVAFLEGLYVVPEARRHGVAAALVATVERWARDFGCRELASDALLDNEPGHLVHRALGFEETERVVYFRKVLG